MPRRFALEQIIDRSMALVDFLRDSGPLKVHNVDNLLLRESMDVIGAWCPTHEPSGMFPWMDYSKLIRRVDICRWVMPILVRCAASHMTCHAF